MEPCIYDTQKVEFTCSKSTLEKRRRCEICSTLTIKTYSTPFSSVSIVHSEQVNISWIGNKINNKGVFGILSNIYDGLFSENDVPVNYFRKKGSITDIWF